MLGTITKSVKILLLSSIWFYSRCISPLFPPTCRYEPTCSAYAREAITKYGPGKGLLLSIKRFLRCHPFSPGGFDPVE